jgi:hypothetical protein
MTIDLWAWLNAVESEARQTNNAAILKSFKLYRGVWQILETDPDQALSRLTMASDLARQERNLCLATWMTHWVSEIYLYYKIDIARGLDSAVRSAAEIRKPEFDRCPIRARAIRQMIDAYQEYDPVGYDAEIVEAIAYLENNVPLDNDTWCAMPEQWMYQAAAMDRLESAKAWGLTGLSRSEHSDFRMMHVSRSLCEIVYRLHEDEELLKYAQLGDFHARRAENGLHIQMSMTLWQAYYHRKHDDEATATRLHTHAMHFLTQQKTAQLDSYYEPLCAYLEADGRIEAALEVRSREIELATAIHSPFRESNAHLARCRLLKLSGQLDEKSLVAARALAPQLRAPQPYLEKLDRLVKT